MNIRFVAGCALMLLVGCLPALPEPTPTIERAPSLAPSPTVLPFIEPESENEYVGRSEPTAAALAAEGEPDQETAITPLPTDATIPMTIIADDGVILRADFFGAPQRPAPGIVLLHGDSGISEELTAAAQSLQAAGYHTMLLHLRGYGASSGKIDPAMTARDAIAAIKTLQSLPAVSAEVAVIGEGSSAIAAILTCTQNTTCRAAAILNPVPDDRQMPLVDAVDRIGALPVLIMAGQDNAGGLQTAQMMNTILPVNGVYRVYPHLSLLESATMSSLIEWLNTVLPLITP